MFNYRKIAWSNYFKDYILCVKYVSDDNWYFVIFGDSDRKHVRKAGTPYHYFKWVSL